MPKLVANMMFSINGEDDRILLQSSIASILPAVDGLVLLETSTEKSLVSLELPKSANISYCYNPDIITEGFAACRNSLLARSPDDCHILWVDSDEVHFTERLLDLKAMLVYDFDVITAHFIHFCLGSNVYERFEKRGIIFRREGASWANKVHELVVHAHPPQVFNSDYHYHHYGYCRDQEYVFSRWKHYALLEGQTNPYEKEEVEGQTVPYFRGDRSGPDKILEDRRKTLIPFHGTHPSDIPKEWLDKKNLQLC